MQTPQLLIRNNDPAVYVLETATGLGDRQTLLRVLNVVGEEKPGLTYAEVGSYMGGTLVPPLLDERCHRVYSIDKRPDLTPDERGVSFGNYGASTAAMVERLRSALPEASLQKLRTFDCDASDLPAGAVRDLDVVFIDGEHTNRATFGDFLALWPLRSRDCVFCFHDANLISDALCNIEQFLTFYDVNYAAFAIRDAMFVILVGKYTKHANTFAAVARDKEAFFQWSKEHLWRGIAETYAKLGRKQSDMPPPP